MSYRPRLTLVAALHAHISYGHHAFRIVRDLEAMSIDVNVRPIAQSSLHGSVIPQFVRRAIVHREQQEDWELMLIWPHAGQMPTSKKKVAYFTMWESTRLPKKSVDLLNTAACVIVPCQWNCESFIASGVKVPVHVAPLGVDEMVFHNLESKPQLECVFGVAGNLGNGRNRKGVERTIGSFMSAFPTEKNVRLKVKVMPGDLPHIYDPRIKVIDKFLPEPDVAEWYRSLSALVAPSKGEGWGCIVLDAMASGVPVICPIYGGLAEFVTPECGYPLDFTEGPAGDHCAGLGQWCEPSEESLRNQMRRVYENRKEAIDKGKAAVERAKAFTWKLANAKLVGLLQEIGALPPIPDKTKEAFDIIFPPAKTRC